MHPGRARRNHGVDLPEKAGLLLVRVAAGCELLQLPVLRLLFLAVVLLALVRRELELRGLLHRHRHHARTLAVLDRVPRAHPAHERVLGLAGRVERRCLALRLAAREPQLAVRLQPLRPGAAVPLADHRALVDAHEVFLAGAPGLDAELGAADAGDRVLGLHLEPLAREQLVHLRPEVPQREPGAERAAAWRRFAQLHARALADPQYRPGGERNFDSRARPGLHHIAFVKHGAFGKQLPRPAARRGRGGPLDQRSGHCAAIRPLLLRLVLREGGGGERGNGCGDGCGGAPWGWKRSLPTRETRRPAARTQAAPERRCGWAWFRRSLPEGSRQPRPRLP